MRTFQEISPGVKTVYKTPVTPLNKFAKVASVLTPLDSQTETSVTFTVAPAAGASVEIFSGLDVVVPPAVRTASGFGGVMPAPLLDRPVVLFLNVSAASGTAPTLDCKVQQLDGVSGLYFDVPNASFAQATGTTFASLSIFQGAVPTVNLMVNGVIRLPYRIAYVIGGASPSFTFSVGGQASN